MRKLLFLLLITTFCLISAPVASAHGSGPPFFRINGNFPPQYSVYSTSLKNFHLPQDIGAEKYLVNTPIKFQIDTKILGFPEDVLAQTKFVWDFGDESGGTGTLNTHTYTKPGSYILSVFAGENEATRTLMESVLIHVLPSENYILPVSHIRVNGQGIADPLIDIIKLPSGKPVNFDPSESVEGSSKIVSYWWDFGDGTDSHEERPTHTYGPMSERVFPILRVQTEDGFIADSYVEIFMPNNVDQSNDPSVPTEPQKTMSARTPSMAVALGVVGIVFVIGVGFYIKAKKK